MTLMIRFLPQLIVLVVALGTSGMVGPGEAVAAKPSATTRAATFCKSYPTKASSAKVSKDQCKKAYQAGYDTKGSSKNSICPKALKGAKLASCTEAYDKGTITGDADRSATQASTTTTTCNGKGIKVSKSLGTGGCIGGGGQNPIFALVGFGVQLLTGLFGIILVLVLVIAGFQYVISGDDPEIAKEAKDRIKGALTGLVLFVIMFALVQAILPSDIKIFTNP